MRPPIDPVTLTPREFELCVKGILDNAAGSVGNYQSTHLATLSGSDGEYIIDIVATFTALGANFMVIVECKHQIRPVERSDVQVLYSKRQSLDAQKAMLFSIAGFQSGAMEFAQAHNIALATVENGAANWHTRSLGPSMPPYPRISGPKYIAWLCEGDKRSLMSADFPHYTRAFLGLTKSDTSLPN